MKQEKGFTLVELLVAMVIGLVVMSAIYSTYVSQQRSSEVTEEVSHVQQSLRAAMYRLERDIRMAGYDPLRKGGFGFTVECQPDQDTISFTYDKNENGVLNNDESITYELDPDDSELKRKTVTSTATIAQNISSINFDCTPDATFNVVTFVDITISGSWRGTGRELKTRVRCRNMGLGL